MATCMETWLIADHSALRDYFPDLNPDRLLPVQGLEERRKEEVIQALKHATASFRKGGYQKGRNSLYCSDSWTRADSSAGYRTSGALWRR